MSKGRARLFFWLKLATSGGLLAYVLSRVDWGEFLELLAAAHPGLIALYLLVGPLMLLVSTVKWRGLLRVKQIDTGLARLSALYYIGHFFNHLMPSSVGGDAMRIYQLGKETGELEECVASVFVERLTGLTALLFFAFVAVALNLGFLDDGRVAGALAAAAAGYLVIVWLSFDPHFVGWILRGLQRTPLARLAARAAKMHEAIRSYGDTPRAWVLALLLSIVFHGIVIANAYIGCVAFGTQPPLIPLALVIPLILLVTMLPISVGGIGLLEWAYFTLFEQIGLPGSLGLSVALLNRVSGILMGGAGGLLYARSLVSEPRRDDYVEA